MTALTAKEIAKDVIDVGDNPGLWDQDVVLILARATEDLLKACKLALTRLNDGTESSAIIARHVSAAILKAEGIPK